MFLKSSTYNRRICGTDAPSSVFLLALFLFIVFIGMDLWAKSFVKQRAATGVEVAMRYLAVNPWDVATARSIVSGYISNSFIPATSSTVSVALGITLNPCFTSNTCTNVLLNTDGKYHFRDAFTVEADLTIPAFVPVPFLRSITTSVYTIGTIETYGCPPGGC